ncbi:MAG: site-specific DNA-methyltransferase [Eubacterium sp.]|nr:site-specific DNA-methyltransferase [Eubacterium sp.]
MEKMKMHTTNLADENYKALVSLFPNALTEKIVGYENGNAIVERAIDADVLRQEISCKVVEGREERYQFTWPDKKRAILLANAPITKTLRPIRQKSIDFENTENLYIEGDNLDVLKLLQETYLEKIKLIYIDPPYNTGSDLVYEDDFSTSFGIYKNASGQYDTDGNRLVKNLDSNGRFHTDWLNMLFPRLRISRSLLREDGLLMISMDENESTNLKKMCDEVFGEINFIGEIIRKTKSMTADNGNGFNTQHEILVIYAKNKSQVLLHGEEKKFSNYTNPDNDPNGEWCAGDPSAKSGGATTSFGIENPYTHRIDYPPVGRYWAFSKSTLVKYIADGKVKFKKDYGEKERGFIFKRYKKDAMSLSGPVHSLFAAENEYMNQTATVEIKKIFNDNVFSYPKPVGFLKKLIQYATEKDDIIMDFFSGSATTAQAVLEINNEENTERKFVLVQLPEVLEENSVAKKAGYQTLCDIGRTRIELVAKKIAGKKMDLGFRYFCLDSSNMKDVYYNPTQIQQQSLFAQVDNIKEDRTPEDLLFQVMLDLGVLLSSKIEEKTIAGKKVFNVAGGFLMACFDKDVTEETVKAVAQAKPYYAVFRDNSMANDSVAANFEQIFTTYSPKTVRKVL